MDSITETATSTNIKFSTLGNLLNQELRHLELPKLIILSSIMDETKSCESLIQELTNTGPSGSNNLNLSQNSIDLIMRHESPTLALLNHWSITGRRRPTVLTLLTYLHRCNLKRAQQYVCQLILGLESMEEPRSRIQIEQSIGQSPELLQLTHNVRDYLIEDQYKFIGLNELLDEIGSQCDRYSFEEIYKTTNYFCHKTRDQNGFRIGEGRFSTVYKAQTHKLSQPDRKETIAAKLLKSDCNIKFLKNEIKLVEKIKHESIIQLIGMSLGRSRPNDNSEFNYICFVYPYMENGSLLDCLHKGLPTKNFEFIKSSDRFNILYKIGQGIAYLHSLPSGPIIHRDIKTANILIDNMAQPKIGDFTLVRQLDKSRSIETQFSELVIGTNAYMPPEAFRGDISIKFDTFSYGIVLLEILTGMRPFIVEQEEDIFTYFTTQLSDIENEYSADFFEEARDRFLLSTLDKKAGNWDLNKCKGLFKVCLKATEEQKRNRPEMTRVVHLIENILDDHLINWIDDL